MANPHPEPHPENLRPAKKGEVRNPNGSSAKQRLTNKLLKLLDDKDLDAAFVRAGMAEALKGDFNFWKYIFERVDGKVPDKFEIESQQSTKILKVPAGKRKRQADPDDGDRDP